MEIEELEEHYRGRTPEELRAELKRLESRMRLRHKTRDGKPKAFTPEQQRQWDEDVAAADHVAQLIEQHEAVRKGYRAGHYQVAFAGGGDEDLYFGDDALRMGGDQVRSAAKRLLERAGKRLDPKEADRVEALIDDKGNENQEESYIARRVLLTENAPYRSAWRQLMTEPHPLLDNEEIAAVRAFKKFERNEFRAMAESPTSAGGFGIPVFIDPSIILTGQGSGNPFLELAKLADINTNAWKGITSAGVSWSFQAEGATVADGSPTLAQPLITVFMARGFIPYSIEIGQDYPSFAEEMSALLASGYDELLVDKFTRGTGTLEPMGLITALDADTNSEVRLTTAGAFGEADFYNVWAKLPQRFRRKASWMMSVSANNAIRRFGTAVAYHASTETLVGGWADRLMNREVYENPYFPDLVNTTGSYNQLVVGDFSNYVVARRGGMNVELVPTLFDVTTNRPTGSRGWFAFARIGGGPAQNAAFRLLNQS